MTKTEQLIRQAIRELHIDIEPHNKTLNIVADTESPGTYKITLAQLKDAWRGKL